MQKPFGFAATFPLAGAPLFEPGLAGSIAQLPSAGWRGGGGHGVPTLRTPLQAAF